MKAKHFITIFLLVSFFVGNRQNWVHNFDQAKLLAKTGKKFLLVDFYANWCAPCKKMDAETWNQPKVQLQMQKMIPVKINIDHNRVIASRFNVKSIPHVFLLDQAGNKLFDALGYQSASDMEKLLLEFPGKIDSLSNTLTELEEKPENPVQLVNVAVAYQYQAKLINDKGRNILLDASTDYLNQAKKYFKKEDNDKGLEKTELLHIYNSLLRGSSKKAVKRIGKIDLKNIHSENKPLAYFIAAVAHIEENQKNSAQEYAEKLATFNGCKSYVGELRTTYSELFP